jgi:hypothetical protein
MSFLLFSWRVETDGVLAQFLRDYFYAGGEGPVPLEVLQNQKYRDVVSIRLYYDWHTCVCLRLKP